MHLRYDAKGDATHPVRTVPDRLQLVARASHFHRSPARHHARRPVAVDEAHRENGEGRLVADDAPHRAHLDDTPNHAGSVGREAAAHDVYVALVAEDEIAIQPLPLISGPLRYIRGAREQPRSPVSLDLRRRETRQASTIVLL